MPGTIYKTARGNWRRRAKKKDPSLVKIQRVLAKYAQNWKDQFPQIIAVGPAYRSLLVIYYFCKKTFKEVEKMEEILQSILAKKREEWMLTYSELSAVSIEKDESGFYLSIMYSPRMSGVERCRLGNAVRSVMRRTGNADIRVKYTKEVRKFS